MTTPRQHRNQIAYPETWVAIDGAIRDAMIAHPDIAIPDKRRASIVKRVIGQVLALKGAGVGKPTETAGGSCVKRPANGADPSGVAGLAELGGQPQTPGVTHEH